MTPKQARDALTTAAKWAAVLFPAIGGAWAVAGRVANASLNAKLDVPRFERDSIARDNRDRLIDARESARDAILSDVDRRTREMYCAGKPAGCR